MFRGFTWRAPVGYERSAQRTPYLCKLIKALVDLIRITSKPAYQFELCFHICSKIKHCQSCSFRNKAKIFLSPHRSMFKGRINLKEYTNRIIVRYIHALMVCFPYWLWLKQLSRFKSVLFCLSYMQL